MRKKCWIEGVLSVHSNSKVRNGLRELSGGMRINGKDFQDKSSTCGNGEHARDRSILYLHCDNYTNVFVKTQRAAYLKRIVVLHVNSVSKNSVKAKHTWLSLDILFLV